MVRSGDWAVVCLAALALLILLSGLDDLFIGLISLVTRRKAFCWPSDLEFEAAAERRIAIFVPAWREHNVIGHMLDRNVAALRYANYHVFVGVYRNDEATHHAVAEVAERCALVHAAKLPHDGPTSKGDCLNWIYTRMREYEDAHELRFDTIVIHDAEDIIHPQELRLISWFGRHYEMVQIPVLALPTPALELTHGLYCDEFAEFQQKDIPVRQWLGGFLPSNGVGCGFDRYALEHLGRVRHAIFDPGCLTEDYDTGFRLHAMGYGQIFVPLRPDKGLVATREYFPRTYRRAILQRSRWVAGIALQSWEFHGWRAPWRQRYWLWRDRKGLMSNLLAPPANVAFICGLVGWRSSTPLWLQIMYCSTFSVTLLQGLMRGRASARIYGWRFAILTPVRMLWGNGVNFAATVLALVQYVKARAQGETLAWRKTEHSYPAYSAANSGRVRLGEILAEMRFVQARDIDEALSDTTDGMRLGERLVQLRKVTEEEVYRALSTQAGIPFGPPRAEEVNRIVMRALPAEMMRRWKVLPYRLEMGHLHLVTTESPSAEMTRELALASGLHLRFRLVKPEDFAKLNALCWAAIDGIDTSAASPPPTLPA